MTVTEDMDAQLSEVTVCRAPGVLWRRSIAGVILLPAESPEPLVLSGAGCLLWDLLAEERQVGHLAEQLARACGLESEEAEAALDDVLDQLCRAGAARRNQS